MLSDKICYPANVENVERAIIMLHGFGSNGADLISLAPLMQKELPNTIFYAPDAPYKLDFQNSFKWFDIETDASAGVFSHFDYIQQLMGRTKDVLPFLDEFIEHVCQKHVLKKENVFLMGFSQGGLLVLMQGLLSYPTVAGVIACSSVPIEINNELSLENIKSKPPILLTHGTADDIVPFTAFQITQNTLTNIGTTVRTHIVPGMGHSLDPSCVLEIIDFIKKTD